MESARLLGKWDQHERLYRLFTAQYSKSHHPHQLLWATFWQMTKEHVEEDIPFFHSSEVPICASGGLAIKLPRMAWLQSQWASGDNLLYLIFWAWDWFLSLTLLYFPFPEDIYNLTNQVIEGNKNLSAMERSRNELNKRRWKSRWHKKKQRYSLQGEEEVFIMVTKQKICLLVITITWWHFFKC